MHQVDELIKVMDKLLSPDGCPWDREQTPQSLVPCIIEEAHELAEALEKNDKSAIREELGDLLYQIVFQSGLAQRQGDFEMGDVADGIREKLIRRHPHVFSNVKVKDTEEVLKNWNEIKLAEKKGKEAAVFNFPQSLPALQRAQKIGDKTKQLKFDWSSSREVLEKVQEEFDELLESFKKNNLNETEEELGDLFFTLAQLARHLKLNAEAVVRKANRKFEDRFLKMTVLCQKRNVDFNALTLDEKEALWKEIKGIS